CRSTWTSSPGRFTSFAMSPSPTGATTATDRRSATIGCGGWINMPADLRAERMLEAIRGVAAQVGSVVVGKHPQIRLALACLLARGHLLIEDLPGVGKTTLAHALATSLGMDFKRVQFTNDLLPAD